MEQIRLLETWQEWFEADHLIATAFLHDWDEQKSKEHFMAEASGEKPRTDVTWGLFDDEGRMMSAIVTGPVKLTFDGQVIESADLHMVGSLPESRGSGSIRRMMEVVLRAYKEKGLPLVVLIPFSFAFYRKFGFELASREMTQRVKIDQFSPFRCTFRMRQAASQADADAARKLYEEFALKRNMADIKSDDQWIYKGNGEFGDRDFWHGDRQHYTYLFTDEEGRDRAYFTYIFNHGPEGPFIGSMEVTDIAFDGPEGLRSIFGFIYGIRSKITDVRLTLPREMDLGLIMPECDDVERRIGGHRMGRVLDVTKMLSLMRHPAGEGVYRIRVEDAFLPENTGTYEAAYRDGRAVSISRTDAAPDLTVTEETFLLLSLGLVDLNAALYRENTVLSGNREVLKNVFPGKML